MRALLARVRALSVGRQCALVATVAQAATILLTWRLWQPRTLPPNLPLVDALAEVEWGLLLVALCAVALFRPRDGSVAFCVVYVLAALGDQIRLQPEVVSLAILMTAPAFGRAGRTVARWHLCALWLWAGLHKALSVEWPTSGARFIADSLELPDLRGAIAVVVPVVEIALGLGVLWPRAWKTVAIGGAAFHAAAVVTLSPLLADFNSAVWPWNAALAVIALVLFSTDQPEPVLTERAVRPLGVLFLLYPALFYVRLADTYLSHNLYSGNGASARVCLPDGSCLPANFDTYDDLNVPLPPEPRLMRDWFRATCAEGGVLHVTSNATRITDAASSRYDC